MYTATLLAPLREGVGLLFCFYLWACCNILSFHHSIEVFCTVHSLIAKCISPFIALLNCYKLAMTLAVSSSSWNVLLIFSCVSFEVLYSIERACENAQLPKISHSRSCLFQVRHLLPDFSLGLPQVAFLCFYVERSHLGGEVIVLHEKQDQHKKCHQM